MKLKLRIRMPDGESFAREFSRAKISLGRDPQSDLSFSEETAGTVSWKHATIRCDERGATLRDAGSTNGTYTNGEKVSEATSLSSGDKFTLGRSGPEIEILEIVPDSESVAATGPVAPNPMGYVPAEVPPKVSAGAAPPPADFAYDSVSAKVEVVSSPPPAQGGYHSQAGGVASYAAGGHTRSTRTLLMGLQKQSRLIWVLAAALIAAIGVVSLIVLFVFPGYLHPDYSDSERQQLIASVEPSVVYIAAEGMAYQFNEVNGTYELARARWSGSGFVMDRKGTIITNFHVVEGAEQIEITFDDGRTVKVDGFLAIEPGKDLAAIRIQQTDDLPRPLRLISDHPDRGETVYPFGSPRGFQGTVTDGIVSSDVRTGSEVLELMTRAAGPEVAEQMGYDFDSEWIQHNAPITHGNSGGPLIDSNGRVVGVNTWGVPGGGEINFASASTNIRRMMESAGQSVRPLSELPPPRHP